MTSHDERWPRRRALLLSCALAMSGLACSTTIAELSVVSSRELALEREPLELRGGVARTGRDCGFLGLGFVPIALPTLDDAIERALDAGGGRILLGQTTRVEEYFLGIGRLRCIVVEGRVPPTRPPGVS